MHCNYIRGNEPLTIDPNRFRLSGHASKESVRVVYPLYEIAARITIER
jgi:hypothetical protein